MFAAAMGIKSGRSRGRELTCSTSSAHALHNSNGGAISPNSAHKLASRHRRVLGGRPTEQRRCWQGTDVQAVDELSTAQVGAINLERDSVRDGARAFADEEGENSATTS
jgi:hypothetical protein